MRKFIASLLAGLMALVPSLALALDASSIPTKIPTYWGTSAPGGNITCPIPIPSQTSITAGRASWTDGFPPLNFLPLGAGGIPPFGQDMNGALCQLSQWTRWFNAGGALPYDPTFQSAIGGYPKGAVIASAAVPGLMWRSTVDNNISNPDASGAGWTSATPPPLCGATGFKIVNDSGAPNTKLDVSAATAVLVAANGSYVNRSAISVVLNFGTVGANGLDASAIAQASIYNIFLIDNGTTTAALASLSATAPALPSGYIYACRLAAIPTQAGSAILYPVYTAGAETNFTTATVPTIAPVAGTCLSVFVPEVFAQIPPTATFAIGSLQVNGTQSAFLIKSATDTAYFVGTTGGGSGGRQYNNFRAPMVTPQTLYYCSSSASNSLVILGWVDAVNAQ